MSMRTLLSEVRSALTGYTDLTDLIPASKITFARRPQRDELPGLTFAIGLVEYDETVQSFAAATTYRVDITAYARSADEATNIHDQIKLALLAANSSVFRIRIADERYFVDVDNNHMAYVNCTWQINSGLTNNQTTLLSPAFQGYDHMDINYNFKVQDGQTTTLSITEQVYYLDFASSSGSATHAVQLPSAEDNPGKMYTIICGNNVDNNTLLRMTPSSGETVETSSSYDMNRAHSSATFVAMQVVGGSSPAYGWRIVSYHGLHD